MVREEIPEVMQGQVGVRPRAVATCPRCLHRDAEVLPAAVTVCPRCASESESGHPTPHLVIHALKVAWYLCGRCNLAFSGSQDEYDVERRQRDKAEADRSHGQSAAQAALEILKPAEPAELVGSEA